MGITFFPDDAQIRTTEEQHYNYIKRTVYLLDHNVTLTSIVFLQIYTSYNYNSKYISIFLLESLFFSDDTQTRTTEDQAYKQTVYLLDHSVTLISIIFLRLKLINKYQVSIFHEDHFFSDDTRIRTSEGQDYKRTGSLSTRPQCHSRSGIYQYYFFLCNYYYCRLY